MEQYQDKLRLVAIALLCFINLGFGLYSGQLPMLVGGAAGMVYTSGAAKRLWQPQRPVESSAVAVGAIRS
jgi:hypothetical protein